MIASMNRPQQHLERLQRNGWTVAAIARVSSVSRSSLYRVAKGAECSLAITKAILAVRGYPPARPAKMRAAT